MTNIKIISQLINRSFHKWISILLIFLASLYVYFTFFSLTNSALPTIMVDNKQFFPFGFYYYYNKSMTPAQRINTLYEIADAGFNTLVLFWDKLDDYSEFLDAAKRRGIYIITDLEDTHSPFAVVEQFKGISNNSQLAWFIADDVGCPGRRSAAEIITFRDQVKALDPKLDHYTYASIGCPKEFSNFDKVADIIGMQVYPIRQNQPDLFGNVYAWLSTAVTSANKHHRPVIANLQTFSWKGDRWPTAAEVYNMTYQALLAGVKGIIFYTYLDEENYIREEPEVWNMTKSLVTEINTLRPILLNGSFMKIDTRVGNVLAGQWTYGSSIYVVIINTSLTETREVSIAIPAKVTGSVQPLFPNRPSSMVLRSGKLTGLIQPNNVHIYKLDQN